MRTPDWQSEDGAVRLYQGDALEVLPGLPAVESIITDPVWPGATVDLGTDDPIGLWRESVARFPEALRVGVHLGCDSNPAVMGVGDRWPFFRACWLEHVQPHYKNRLLYTSDVAYLWGEPPLREPGRAVIPGKCIATMVGESVPRDEHPCPRRLTHAQWLVRWWSDAEVLDPFMGSGTTGVAAIRLGRRFIGIELNPDYFNIAVRRIQAAIDEGALYRQAEREPDPELFAPRDLAAEQEGAG